ncbi:hypothetical protein H8356DRAFT_1321629 [Neocallimastix lanati (nom. inval.)]|nr:hypothetical protein H8356DRAFT_1321629 [Neocallimastix sp. JGI-2020a]
MANDDFFLSKNVKVIRAMKGKEFRGFFLEPKMIIILMEDINTFIDSKIQRFKDSKTQSFNQFNNSFLIRKSGLLFVISLALKERDVKTQKGGNSNNTKRKNIFIREVRTTYIFNGKPEFLNSLQSERIFNSLHTHETMVFAKVTNHRTFILVLYTCKSAVLYNSIRY